MKNVDLHKATKRTRFNRAREKKGSMYTFTNAIDGAHVFRGVNKKQNKRDSYTAFLEYAVFIETVIIMAWAFCETFLE